MLPAACCSTEKKAAPLLPGGSSTSPACLLTLAFLLPHVRLIAPVGAWSDWARQDILLLTLLLLTKRGQRFWTHPGQYVWAISLWSLATPCRRHKGKLEPTCACTCSLSGGFLFAEPWLCCRYPKGSQVPSWAAAVWTGLVRNAALSRDWATATVQLLGGGQSNVLVGVLVELWTRGLLLQHGQVSVKPLLPLLLAVQLPEAALPLCTPSITPGALMHLILGSFWLNVRTPSADLNQSHSCTGPSFGSIP